MADFGAIPYGIRIGVTGHRKLEYPLALQSLVKKAIDSEIEKLFPEKPMQMIRLIHDEGTTAISFRVLNPLAEGAGRLVAREV